MVKFRFELEVQFHSTNCEEMQISKMIIYRIDLKLKQTFSLFYKDYKKIEFALWLTNFERHISPICEQTHSTWIMKHFIWYLNILQNRSSCESGKEHPGFVITEFLFTNDSSLK